MDIAGTSAIVTGGASGLGAATAKTLADKGAQVFGLDLQASIDRAGSGVPSGVTLVAADVTDEAQVTAAVEQAVASGRRCGPSSTAPESAGRAASCPRTARTTSNCSAPSSPSTC